MATADSSATEKSTYPSTPRDIAHDLWFHREELRRTADVSTAIRLARDMLTEIETREDDGEFPRWCNGNAIDALLACAQAAADQAYRAIVRSVGELGQREEPPHLR